MENYSLLNSPETCLSHIIFRNSEFYTTLQILQISQIISSSNSFLLSNRLSLADEDIQDIKLRTYEKKFRDECLQFIFIYPKNVTEFLTDPILTLHGKSNVAEFYLVILEDNTLEFSESLLDLKESGDLSGFYGKLAIIALDLKRYTNIKVGILCYMCHLPDSIHWFNLPLDKTKISKAFQQFERNGHKRAVYLGVTADLENYEEEANCEVRMYFAKVTGCGVSRSTVVLQILKTRLNLTARRLLLSDLDDPDEQLSLKVATPLMPPNDLSLENGDVKLFFRDVTDGKLFYCTEAEKFEEVEWNIFLKPVKPVVWILIVGIVIFYGILEKSWYLGLRGFLFLVNQPLPYKNMKYLILPLTFITSFYLSNFTIDVVIPPSVWVVPTNKELFDRGFRFVVPSASYLPVVKERADASMKKLGLEWNPDYFTIRPDIMEYAKELQPQFFLMLGSINGIYHTLKEILSLMKEMKLLTPRSNRYGNVTCSVVTEDWDDKVWSIWLISSHMSNIFMKYSTQMLENGFCHFWTIKKHRNTLLNMEVSRYCQSNPELCLDDNHSQSSIKGLKSSLKVIFVFLAIFCSLGLATFAIEMLLSKTW